MRPVPVPHPDEVFDIDREASALGAVIARWLPLHSDFEIPEVTR